MPTTELPLRLTDLTVRVLEAIRAAPADDPPWLSRICREAHAQYVTTARSGLTRLQRVGWVEEVEGLPGDSLRRYRLTGQAPSREEIKHAFAAQGIEKSETARRAAEVKAKELQKRAQELEQVMRAAGWEPLEAYPGATKRPWKCRCVNCGNLAAPHAANVLRGTGCLICAVRRREERKRSARSVEGGARGVSAGVG